MNLLLKKVCTYQTIENKDSETTNLEEKNKKKPLKRKLFIYTHPFKDLVFFIPSR